VIWSRSFEKIYRLLLDGHESIQAFTTLRTKAVQSFHISEENYTTTWCNNPKDLLLHYEIRFAASKIPETDVISSW